METIKDELAPQGSVIPPIARDAGGVPIVTVRSGYDGHYPVQFDNEADEDFLGRVAQFESSYANAVKNEPGSVGIDAAKSALEARYEADLLALDREYKVVEPAPKKGKDETDEEVKARKEANEESGKKTVESEDGSRRTVKSSYVLKDGETEV